MTPPLRPTGPLHHLAILASAGTGKTHALAHRYIGLLGRGVDADRICSLTFSRKAATEIFDSIVACLVKAALSPEAARQTAGHAGLEGLTTSEAARLLRNLVTRLHRVQIGTLDGFIVNVLRAFSSELGVPSDFALLGSGTVEARQLTQEALGFLLAPARTQAQNREIFYDAYKKATYGREEKGLGEAFFIMLENSLGLFRRFPDPDCWGNPAVIWGRTEWLRNGPKTLEKALEQVERFLDVPAEVKHKLMGSLTTASTFEPFNTWNKEAFDTVLMTRLLEQMENLDSGGTLPYGRKSFVIDPETGRAIRAILGHLVRQEITRALKQTQGLGSLLNQFQALYDETIRKRGAFTFNDAQYLLTPRNPHGGGPISRRAGEADRLYIDYRLDARLDHWLLDEFQDTSDLQWETLDNLASEIIQDTGGDRSFFLVGDVKQAIHGWRGGNARLLGRLLTRYDKGMALKTLSASFRSTPPVLDFVNSIFSDLRELELPNETVERWQELWETHVSRVDKPGCAAWIEPAGEDGADSGDSEAYRAAAGLIRDLDPATRGLSVAVLLPTNDACTKAADALRHELAGLPIPVVNEGAAELAGNPVVALMRSLALFAAHPGDLLAATHLRMSPLRQSVEEAGDRLPLILQEQIQSEGFTAFFQTWAARLEAAIGPLDAFGAKRLGDLLALAAEMDASGNRDPDTLAALVDTRVLREQAAGGAVRIMTIHQSKGLGFDAVIVPFLENGDIRKAGQLDLVSGATGSSPWVLKMPRQSVCQADRVLKSRTDAAAAETAFANLCVLYVALTRARQGLYVITHYGLKKRNKNRSLSEGILLSRRLLDTALPESVPGENILAGGIPLRRLFLTGNWNWCSSTPPVARATEAATRPAASFPSKTASTVRLKRVEPSRGDSEVRPADWLFKPEARGVLDFGTLIHEYLAQVEWCGPGDAESILPTWKPSKTFDEGVRRDAEAQFRKLLASPDVVRALARPAGESDLWREKRFELVDKETWISGAFDRVLVFRDATGRPLRATIMDFKSNRIENEADMAKTAELYRHQLVLYRQALARILRLDETSIDVQILFTRLGRIFNVPY
ncbi:MAG: UvrD-helicase domain-containing protein [Kiritimatiellia bacterium]